MTAPIRKPIGDPDPPTPDPVPLPDRNPEITEIRPDTGSAVLRLDDTLETYGIHLGTVVLVLDLDPRGFIQLNYPYAATPVSAQELKLSEEGEDTFIPWDDGAQAVVGHLRKRDQ